MEKQPGGGGLPPKARSSGLSKYLLYFSFPRKRNVAREAKFRQRTPMAHYHDIAGIVSKEEQLSRFRQHFTLDPKQLRGLELDVNLEWQTVRFTKRNVTSVAKLRGVYAFAVAHTEGSLPPHSYVLYIGQTGAKPNERTLRKRVGDYFNETHNPKRPHVYKFLKKWRTCLLFHFAPLDPHEVDLLDIEAKLNDALMPPYSVNDFSPEIRKAKRLMELT